MLDIKKCPLIRQEQELNHSIAEGKMISLRCNAHVFYAVNERSKRKSNLFRVHIMREEVG